MASYGHQAISADASARGRSRKRTDGWEGWGGGYMEAKKQKLNKQFSDEAPDQLKKEGSGSKIFSGISIYVNGYTKPSSDELKRLMMLHGGNYEHYLYRTKVTHVIATNLPDSKVRELKGLKVVRPEWIMDSIKSGKLLSYTPYQLYTAKSGHQKGLSGYTVKHPSTESSSTVSSTICDFEPSSEFTNGLDSLDSRSDLDLNERSRTMDTSDIVGFATRVNAEFTNMENSSKSATNESVKQKSINTNFDKSQLKPESSGDSHHSTSKAGDPKFLNEFYNNSRLHHLSTWKAEFREYVNHLQSTGTSFPGREKLRQIVLERDSNRELQGSGCVRGKPKRCVMHIDMDCFFVSVGLRRRPDLKGKPVAVTHSKGKGATPTPGSDFNFERQQWELKRLQGGKKGKKTTGAIIQQCEGDLSFPDLSDSDSEEDIPSGQVTIATEEPFHSMAEIASCSYEARKAGVKNGMFMGRAKQICPDLVTIPYDFEGYQTVSKALYDTVASYTHDIEAVSCDEMLVDCTDLLSSTGATPLEFASLLRQEIYTKTKCTASAGLASNILLAKMATRKAKPDGQFYLEGDEVQHFMAPQSVRDIPGVGWSMTKKLENMKVNSCGDLQKVNLDTLQREFGLKTGQSLHRYCRGQDDRPIQSDHQRKSVSAEVNYGIRFTTENEAVRFLQELSEEVCNRLKSMNMKGKSVTLKLMVRREDAPKETSKFLGHGICNNMSKSVSLPLATDDARIVGKECVTILRQQRAAPEDLRGIGIQIQKLEPANFGTSSAGNRTQSILSFTVNKAQASKQNGDSEPKCIQKSNIQNLNKQNHEVNHTENKLATDESETAVVDISSEQSNERMRINDQSERTRLNIDQSDSRKRVAAETLPVLELENSKNSEALENLVEELGRRQLASSQLPPLPTLPDIPTPGSNRKKLFKSSTPGVTQDKTKESEDYFPSPSQVDPAVLKELPPEIREQIEKEMTSRQLRRKPATSEQGCSHWYKGGNSGGTDAGRSVTDKSKDVIEPLPSPSQIDMSCLNALPPSLQREIKEAYARQDSKKLGAVRKDNILKLQQAKSPGKSPNKRSPKKSPQFKVPGSKPSGRGKKKATSKKLLFKDQAKTVTASHEHESEQGTRHETMSSDHVSHRVTGKQTSDKDTAETLPSKADLGKSSEDVGVNLCGAVDIKDVRSLIKEWICSTPEPQQEDEEVLGDYLEKLVHDKNLEQVDLVLKYMYRNIHFMNSKNWLLALKRIFTQVQGIVRALHGSTLNSIPVL